MRPPGVATPRPGGPIELSTRIPVPPPCYALHFMAARKPNDRPVIFGHEVLSLLAARGGHALVEELRTDAARVFGPHAIFANCRGDSFGFDDLLAFLESAGKLSRAEGTVALGPVPACSGH